MAWFSLDKIELHLTSTCFLKLLAAEYLRETNISIFISHSLIVICSLDAFKKSSKRKDMRIKKENVEVLQQTLYSRKETGKQKIGMMKSLTLTLTLHLLARVTLTLISSPAIIGCQKVNFQGFNLVKWNFQSSAFLSVSCELFKKIGYFMRKYSVLVKIRESFLYVTNHCIKVTSKLILPSVSRFKCFPYYKSRVKLIFI